jgi:hypothetical protein
MRVAIKKTDHATRGPWTPGKYDVVCSAHNDISTQAQSRTSASQYRDYNGVKIVGEPHYVQKHKLFTDEFHYLK